MSLLPASTLLMFAQVGSNIAYLMWHGVFVLSGLVLAVCMFGGIILGYDFITCLLCRTHFGGKCHAGYLASTSTAVIVGILISVAIEGLATKSIPFRAKPLISALDAYEAKYNKPPDTLQSLVPEFIGAIPHTGMPGFPNYEYHLLAPPERSRWELGVERPSVDIFEPEWRFYRPFNAAGERNIAMRLSDWISVRK